MSEYSKAIKNLVDNGFLQKPEDPLWKDVPLPEISDLVLAGSLFSSEKYFKNIYSNGYILEQRPEKKLERIIEKSNKLPKINPYFKIHSDLTGFKIKCSFEDIFKVVDLLIKDLHSEQSYIYIEKNVLNPNEKDIIQRLYVYDLNISSTIIEFLIGHPFALEVFKMNSFERSKKHIYPNFFNNNVYKDTKNLIIQGLPIKDFLQDKDLLKFFNFNDFRIL